MLCFADCGPKFVQLWRWRRLALSYWWFCWVSERERHHSKWSGHWLYSKTMMHLLFIECCGFWVWYGVCNSVIELLFVIMGNLFLEEKEKRMWLLALSYCSWRVLTTPFAWDCWCNIWIFLGSMRNKYTSLLVF